VREAEAEVLHVELEVLRVEQAEADIEAEAADALHKPEVLHVKLRQRPPTTLHSKPTKPKTTWARMSNPTRIARID
jgi:hypothetical protein